MDQTYNVISHVLFLAAWYPNEDNRLSGVFIKEHALAVARYTKVTVLHLRLKKTKLQLKSSVVVEKTNDNLTVYQVTIKTPIRRLGVHDNLVTSIANSTVKRVIEEQGEFDLFHIHVRDHITSLLPDIPTLQGRPFLLTEHWSFYHTGIYKLPQEEQNKQRSTITEWFKRKELKFVCPVSKELGEHLIKGFGIPTDKIQVIPNVASEVFRLGKTTKNHGDEFEVALVATWRGPKNPFVFIAALKLLSDEERNLLNITWVGEGEQMIDVREQVASYGWSNIKFAGQLTKSEVAEVLQRADLLVHPSNAENAPCIISESLCCGTPVLSMNINGIPEMVDNSNGLLCPPKDAKALADCLTTLMTTYSFDRKTVASKAQAKFYPDAVGSAYINCYAQLREAVR